MNRNGLIMLLMAIQSNAAYSEGSGVQEAPKTISYTAEQMVVVASKTSRPINDVAGSVSNFQADYISDIQAGDFDDMFRYHPGLSLESTGARFQSSSINIRGIGGNRVAIEVDGVPTTDGFDVGSYANSARLLPEIDLIRQAEVLHGPASTLYGSDAIGGIVSISTWDPEDLVGYSGNNNHIRLHAGYEGKNHGQFLTGLGAFRHDYGGVLLSATRRNGKGINNDGLLTAPSDRLDWDSEAIFAKATFNTSDFDKLSLAIHTSRTNTDTELASLTGVDRFANTTSLTGDDSTDARRFSLKYEFDTNYNWLSENTLNIYYLGSNTRQSNTELRTSFGMPVRQFREFRYGQEIIGAEFFTANRVDQESITHNIVAGVDFSQTRVTEQRDASQTNLVTNAVSKSVLGESFPLRDFPKSETTELGLYIQDELMLSPQWVVIPALRFDAYHLSADSDEKYLRSNPQQQVVSITETAVAPKIGFLRHLDDNTSLFAQYVHGFKAPPFEDANIALNVPFLNTRALPNPDLKSERSDGIELGMRQLRADSSISTTFFYNRYKDFIESRALVGTDAMGTLLFQSRNLTSAEIYGVEISTRNELSAWFSQLEGWHLASNWSFTRGNNLENNEPLNSISPPQAVIELGWEDAAQFWHFTLFTTITASKKRVDESAVSVFKPDGYVTADALLRFTPDKYATLSLGVFNLADKRYWRWQDVRSLNSSSQIIDAVMRPERHFALSYSVSW